MSDDTTIHILRDIQARLAKLEHVPAELAELRREMRERHDDLLAIFGASYREHERRIHYLDARMDRLDPPPDPRRRR